MRVRKRRILLAVLALAAVLFLILEPYYSFLTKKVKISPLKTLISSNSLRKVGSQVNILILGIPGGAHDGPNLSDSIIVVNYDFKKNRALTIGIPRDLWSDTLRDRINSAYAYGEEKVKGGGIRNAKAEVAAIVGMPIQYAAVINFSDFRDLVDYVDGVDVTVERTLLDKKFPIEGRENDECGGDPQFRCRYETIEFKRGMHHMRGVQALKFVRSRNAIGVEGSDFARNQRQQLVLSALKGKIGDTVKSLNLRKIEGLYDKLDQLVARDISNQQVATLAKKVFFGKNFYQKNFHLSNDIFIVPDYRLYDGKYVLVPENEDFEPIHEFVSCLLIREDEKVCLSDFKK